MPRKKLTINATEDQLDRMYKSLEVGTPITIALQYAGISAATYFYWVAIASVVIAVKEQEELEQMEEIAKSGVSLQQCRDLGIAAHPNRKLALGTFIEPSGESILQYKNSTKFRKFANQVYEIVSKCNQIRSEVAMKHLGRINKSTTDRHINASGSMWFLERCLGDYFGRPSDKAKEEENKPGVIGGITVEFVDPQSVDSKERLENMEQLVISEMKGSGDA